MRITCESCKQIWIVGGAESDSIEFYDDGSTDYKCDDCCGGSGPDYVTKRKDGGMTGKEMGQAIATEVARLKAVSHWRDEAIIALISSRMERELGIRCGEVGPLYYSHQRSLRGGK